MLFFGAACNTEARKNESGLEQAQSYNIAAKISLKSFSTSMVSVFEDKTTYSLTDMVFILSTKSDPKNILAHFVPISIQFLLSFATLNWIGGTYLACKTLYKT